ncbi:MAG: HAMP domain-containing histidine kinase [Pseudomonadales bacterium]|nr:HAMP domain-containing histidine kinase [Pseudomonadales bacterium]
MSSAEVTLQLKTQVGNVSPTMLQTLLNLLNLYLDPDTDREKLIEIIESDTSIFRAFLQAASTATLPSWHEAFSKEQLSDLALALANQVAAWPLGSDAEEESNTNAIAAISRSLMSVLDPDQVRDVELIARLIGTDVSLQEPHFAQALKYFERPLETLHGTHLLTRTLASAANLNGPTADLNACAALLSLDSSILEDLISAPEQIDPASDVSARFVEKLSQANLYASTMRLATQMDRLFCLKEISATLFSTDQVAVFTQNQKGWSNGEYHFEVPQSLIVAAADTGQTITTPAHTMTVMDDEALKAIGATDGIAIPVLLEESDTSSCAAVVLLGMTTSALMTLSSRQELMTTFNTIARGLFRIAPTREIALEDVDNRAREIIHEANNPLSTVQNYLKVLALKLGPDHEAQPTLESIGSELMRAADIIGRFRDIPESAGQSRGRCDINQALRTVATLFDKGNEHIHFNYPLSRQAMGSINPDDFKQIATNLIKNAVEELNSGGSITLQTQSDLRFQNAIWVEVAIIDTGPGIQTGVGDIFERGISTKAGAHVGEGLAVVKQLTERCGGFVSYRTSQDGTEFRITLPQSQTRTG